MELGSFVDRLRRELVVAADAGGEESRALAERLIAPLDSAMRLVLLEALTEAADAITRDLAPGSVHVRLRGREADFVVTPPPVAEAPAVDVTKASVPVDEGDGPAARINFRPPESLKNRIEEAAGQAGVSVNAWLVRTLSAALDPAVSTARAAPSSSRNHFTGWAG
jgi:hypothetical protein